MREKVIGGDCFGGLIRNLLQPPGAFLALLVLAMLFLVAGCGGGGEQKAQQPPPPPDVAPKDNAKDAAKGKAVEAKLPSAGTPPVDLP